MHRTVALTAIFGGGVLDVDVFRKQGAIAFEGAYVPFPFITFLADDIRAEEGGGVRPGEVAVQEFLRAGLVVGVGQVAEEAVHFHCA